MKNKNLIFSIVAIVLFAIIAAFYCSPVLSGNQILQPDIVNYKGSAQEMNTFEQQTGEKTFWSNAMFGGMPTYQTGAKYDYDFIKKIDLTLRFLPRPADYIFLLFMGFFILGMVLFKNWKYALVGSVFFAFCAYFFIIIAAGHNAKVHAIAYFAPLVAGIILLYRGKLILGFLLTTLFMGLELSANHPQMTYYLLLGMLVYFIVQLIYSFKYKTLKTFAKATVLLLFASLIGFGLNATRYITTYEYSKETTRGKSDMTLLQNNRKGLDKEYITHWSYGKLETFNLFIPNFMGGASQPKESDLKNYIAELGKQQQYLDQDEFDQQAFQYLASSPVSTYWGEQPGTSGPAYQGAIVVFLFLLGLFLVKGKWAVYKWWLIGATILSILLAWGKNFDFLTNFFIDYFPFYDKFRAVSSILVIAELTMPILAIITLYVFFKDENLTEEFKKKVLYIGGGSTVLLLLIFYLFGGSLFDFTTQTDELVKQQFIGFVKEYKPSALGTWDSILTNVNSALIKDRVALFKADTLRTLLLVLLTLGFLLAYQFKIIKQSIIVVLGIGFIAVIDGLQVNKRYLNDDNFVPKLFVDNPFPVELSPRLMDEASKNPYIAGIANKVPYNKTLDSIQKSDKSQYRVFNNIYSTFNEATTSYYVNSIGGYHGAKLSKYQDIIDVYFSDNEATKKLGINGDADVKKILNLLNTKYIIQGEPNMPITIENVDAMGNAWLASNIKWVKNANEEILALKDTNLRNTVVLREDLYADLKSLKLVKDSLSNIKLVDYKPNKITYSVKTNTPQIAVFSEIYYPHGWEVTVNSNEKEILKADYFLRAVPLNKGDNKIVMEFKPQSVKIGNAVTLASNIIFIILLLGGLFYGFKNRDKFLNA